MAVISRYRWRISLTTALILAALILSLLATLVTRATSHAAESLTQISSDPYTNPTSNHKTEVEPDTFAFGNTIVATFQVGRFFDGGASNIGFATSTNGGATWTHGFLPSSTVFATPAGEYARASDPSVAYDAKHKVWIISWLGLHSSLIDVDVLVSRSTDGGKSFGPPVTVNDTGTFNDKNWSVCDDTASSPFYGHCYTEFDKASNINLEQMSTSTDGGKTWGPALTTPDHACVIGGQPLVQPNGTVIVPVDDCFETALLAFRSTDGGKSWSRTVLAAQIIAAAESGALRSGPLPTAEIDKSGKVYVVWDDCRFEGPNCNFPGTPNDLVMTTSTDGIHWTLVKRIPINPVGSGVDHFIPGLAVDRTTSGSSAHLGLAYYFYPNSNCSFVASGSTPACQLDVGFISSTNGGASWSAPEQLAGPMKLTWLPLTTQGFMVGDYISTSIVPGDDDATPVFEVASPPTGTSSCSNLSTGAPGQNCHQATFTTSEDVLKIVGGTNVSHDVAPSILKKSGLSKPATHF